MIIVVDDSKTCVVKLGRIDASFVRRRVVHGGSMGGMAWLLGDETMPCLHVFINLLATKRVNVNQVNKAIQCHVLYQLGMRQWTANRIGLAIVGIGCG